MKIVTEGYSGDDEKGQIGEVGGLNHPLGDLVASAYILFKEGIIAIEIESSLEDHSRSLPQPELTLKVEISLEKGLDAVGDSWLEKLKVEGLEEGFYSKPK